MQLGPVFVGLFDDAGSLAPEHRHAFLAAEDVAPWMVRWLATPAKTNPNKADLKKQSELAEEVAEALITDKLRRLYITRLEESAPAGVVVAGHLQQLRLGEALTGRGGRHRRQSRKVHRGLLGARRT